RSPARASRTRNWLMMVTQWDPRRTPSNTQNSDESNATREGSHTAWLSEAKAQRQPIMREPAGDSSSLGARGYPAVSGNLWAYLTPTTRTRVPAFPDSLTAFAGKGEAMRAPPA